MKTNDMDEEENANANGEDGANDMTKKNISLLMNTK